MGARRFVLLFPVLTAAAAAAAAAPPRAAARGVSPGYLHDDFSVCPGCPECRPEAPAPSVEVPRPLATEKTARLLHDAVRSIPSGILGQFSEEAAAAGLDVEELAEQKISEAVRRVRRFWRSLRKRADARGLTPEALLVRMALTGSMGPEGQ